MDTLSGFNHYFESELISFLRTSFELARQIEAAMMKSPGLR